MNKIIFQIGLLAFCISAVLYATQGLELLEVVAKAFIIFVATIAVLIGIIFAVSMLSVKEKETQNAELPPKTV